VTWVTAVLLFVELLAAMSVGYLIGARSVRPGVRYRDDPPVTRNWPE
jgi:hypothetical protein